MDWGAMSRKEGPTAPVGMRVGFLEDGERPWNGLQRTQSIQGV